MEAIGNRIKIAADKIGGLDALANRIEGMSRRSLSDYVNGKTDPKASLIQKISKEAGVSAGWLITGEGQADNGVDAVLVTPDGTIPLQAKRSQVPQASSVIDEDRLVLAIETIEEGLDSLGRVASAEVKAGLIIQAYRMMEAEGQKAMPRIFRLVASA